MGSPNITATRQVTEQIISTRAVLAAAGQIESVAVRARGYGSIVGLSTSDRAGTVRIFQANPRPIGDNGRRTQPDDFVQTNVLTTQFDAVSGLFTVEIGVPVVGEFVRVRYDNGATGQGQFNFLAYLLPHTGGSGGGGGGGSSGGVANRSAVAFETATVAAPGTPVPGPDLPVPDGFALNVRQRITQAGSPQGFIADSAAAVVISTQRLQTLKGDILQLYITNANLLFFDSDTAGTIFEFFVEQ